MKLLLAFSLCVVAVFAGGLPDGYDHHEPYAFHGHYPGECGNDGFYYKDHYSFIICSNGNSYDQPCAPGSRNSEYGRYSHGHNYYYRDFCDINLVDFGFGAHHEEGHGYAGHRDEGHGYAGHRDEGYGYAGHRDGY